MITLSTTLLIPLAPMIPNILFALKPATNALPETKPTRQMRIWTVMERAGQLGVFLMPLRYRIGPLRTLDRVLLALMVALIAFYYLGWARYFTHNGDRELLFAPMWSIPLPLAYSPVLFFMLAAGLLRSLPMFIASSLLAAGHIPLSYVEHERYRTKHKA
ncbi:MAG: hypothetical protein ACM3ZQ_10190 [Bacillota bacterium]